MAFANDSAKGAWAASLVAADLLARGHEVYEAVGPASGLAIVVRGVLRRVKVRCANRRGERLHFAPLELNDVDLLAVVLPEGDVHYLPGLDGEATLRFVSRSVLELVEPRPAADAGAAPSPSLPDAAPAAG